MRTRPLHPFSLIEGFTPSPPLFELVGGGGRKGEGQEKGREGNERSGKGGKEQKVVHRYF